MASYKLLAEQVQRIYARVLHRDDITPTLDIREAKQLVSQAVNKVLKAQTKEGFTVGDIEVPMCSIATYTVAVSSSGGISTLTLPAVPIPLPMNMGLWSIYDPLDPWNPYIPIVGQDAQVMQGAPASYLEQQVGYDLKGLTVRFTSDIYNASPQITSVEVEILVQELSAILETDLLPFGPDQELMVIKLVFEMLGLGQVALAEINKNEEIKKQIDNE